MDSHDSMKKKPALMHYADQVCYNSGNDSAPPTYSERFALFIVGGQGCFAPCPPHEFSKIVR